MQKNTNMLVSLAFGDANFLRWPCTFLFFCVDFIPLATQREPNFQWNIGCKKNLALGMYISCCLCQFQFALGGQRKPSFQWNMGLRPILTPTQLWVTQSVAKYWTCLIWTVGRLSIIIGWQSWRVGWWLHTYRCVSFRISIRIYTLWQHTYTEDHSCNSRKSNIISLTSFKVSFREKTEYEDIIEMKF